MHADSLVGTLIGGRFEVEALAGSGGMGAVYRAIDRESGTHVAIKVLHAGVQTHVERFLREARLLAKLEHPGIVGYVDDGDSPAPFLAMEWLEGEDLGRRLSRGSIPLRDALTLTLRVAEALDAAHRRGVVHRDIKPTNIFLVGGRCDRVKLLDFGIARLVAHSSVAMTLSGQVLGTIGYMAPEQAREGKDVRASVDVFSLGCVLFECLAGKPAFAGDKLMAVLAKILFADIPRVSDVRDDVPPVVDELVWRMMQKSAADRPALPSLIAELEAIAAQPRLRELRPRPRSVDSVEGPAISADENRLLAVVLAEEGLGKPSHSSPTISIRQMHLAADELERTVEPFGARLEMLSNAAQIAVLSGSDTATDLAVSAARCALAMRLERPSTPIAVAIGRGDPSGAEQIADVVSHAEGLLDAATDGIRVDRTMADLLDARFELAADGEHVVLVAERASGQARSLLGRPTPFVGRDRDLATLRAMIDESFDEPIAGAIVITGEAGIGKSRLARELLAEHADVATWTARGDASARGSSFSMLAQLLRAMCGLVDGEPAEIRRDKIYGRVARHVAPVDATTVAEFLGEIVGAEFPSETRTALRSAREDPALMGEQTLRAWEKLVLAEASAHPVLIVLEDLQWGDRPTARFMDAALRAARELPFVVLALARPEIDEVLPDLFRERRVQKHHLSALTPRAAKKLVSSVLPHADETTAGAIVERAGGNAFYLEELIRATAEEREPASVIAMAHARLERLDPRERLVLRAASVFGRTFWAGGVAGLVRNEKRDAVIAILETLAHRELVVRPGGARFRGEEDFAFSDMIVREAAYGMLTDRDRHLGHKLAAAWLEAAGERDASVMAQHLERGGEPGGAIVWYLWAAEQALEANDFPSVIARAERGIACGASGPVLGELLLLEAEARGWSAGGPDHASLASRSLALALPSTSASSRAAAELAAASCRRGDERPLATAIESLSAHEQAVGIAHALAVARTLTELYECGRAGAAEPLARALEEATPLYEEDLPVISTFRAWSRAARSLFAGDPIPYAENGRALVAALEEHGQLRLAVVVELHTAYAFAALGAHFVALEWASRALARSERMQLAPYVGRARAVIAKERARLGDLEVAERLAREAIASALDVGDRGAELRARAVLAFVLGKRGAWEDAAEQARLVVQDEIAAADVHADATATLLCAAIERGDATLEITARGASPRLALARADVMIAVGIDASRILREAADAVRAAAAAIANPEWRASYLAIEEHAALLSRAG
jgi:serine/threonine protein kinase